jgi:tRNA-splicing ligase RtcB (3'-phosphate/5'-hydroxy nucleic acid ligase)
MTNPDLIRLGLPTGPALHSSRAFITQFIRQGGDPALIERELTEVIANPAAFLGDPLREALARDLYAPAYKQRDTLAPWRQWGSGLDPQAVQQIANACALPISVAGALMPDAHIGYGLPIGGVLATDHCVIPYAVGVDIACRMRLSVYDRKANIIPGQRGRLINILQDETVFGIGGSFKLKRQHEVMDEDWAVSPITRRYKDKAWAQLGTSGSGNHFVEFGAFAVSAAQSMALQTSGFDLRPGEYLALLSHSGSRGTGAQVCQHYSRIAMDRRYDLPNQLKHLAWLSFDEEAGQEYWAAMNLMGRYAAANHALIHKHIAKKVGAHVMLSVENHHNFAWKETHLVDGQAREVVVHRKGATPAGLGELGVIPGSMATPGFLVRGKGQPLSLNSASHGAGRLMSRTQALQSFTWSTVKKQLATAGVELLSAGLDEVPGVYKDIHSVMNAQQDLVEVLGQFSPRIVKMSPSGEKAED